MKYIRKNKYVVVTEDNQFAIVKVDNRCYHIKRINDGHWGMGEYIVDSDGDVAMFFWLKTAKEYIKNNFYSGRDYDVEIWGRSNSIILSIKDKPLYFGKIRSTSMKSAKELAWKLFKESDERKWLRRADVRIECERS